MQGVARSRAETGSFAEPGATADGGPLVGFPSRINREFGRPIDGSRSALSGGNQRQFQHRYEVAACDIMNMPIQPMRGSTMPSSSTFTGK